MAELAVYASVSDGFIRRYPMGDASWAEVHGAENGGDDVIDPGGRCHDVITCEDEGGGSGFTTLIVVQSSYHTGNSQYHCERGFLFFDTSPLGAGAKILSAVLSLYGLAIGGTETDEGDATLHVIEGIQSDPFVAADYGSHLSKITSGGSLAHGDYAQDQYNDITLNATSRGWINKTGTTKFCLRTAGDINNHTPTGLNRVSFASRERGSEYAPKLTITYALAGARHHPTHPTHPTLRK